MAFDKYDGFFEALPSPHMVLDTELRYVAANPAYCEVVGKRVEDLIGNGLFELFPNEGKSGQELRESIMRVIETGKSDTIAYLHYAIPIPDAEGGFEDRYWTAVHFPIHDADGYVEFVVQNTVDVTELHSVRRNTFLPFRSARLQTALIQRAQEAEEAHKTLLEENNDFRRLFNQAPGMIAVLTGPEHVFTFVNEAYSAFIGERRVLGRSIRDALPEIVDQSFIEKLDRVYQTGEPVNNRSMPVTIRQSKTGQPTEAFVDFSFHPIFDNGKVSGIFAQGLDRTESVQAERARELLVRELNHRVKNLFTVAMSMVNMTARNAETPREMADILTGRLGALSHAHGMVLNESGPGGEGAKIGFDELVTKIVAPHVDEGGKRLTRDGPKLTLGPKAATSLALVTHELATNAAKYGALSTIDGQIDVRWQVDDENVELVWREIGGPKIEGTPEPSGFGSRLSRISVEGQLGGKLAFDWPHDGVAVTITFPRENALR